MTELYYLPPDSHGERVEQVFYEILKRWKKNMVAVVGDFHFPNIVLGSLTAQGESIASWK